MKNNLGTDPQESKASGELRMCQYGGAASSAYSVSHMQELPESEFKLNTSITLSFGLQQKVLCRRI